MRPILAFLTDFGLDDAYVGAMKGAALSVCPEATLVDVTHAVPPHDIAAGAYALDAAFRFFPPGTSFVVVVDPGVGSARRGLAVSAAGYRFVGPDNGVLTPALALEDAAVVALTNPEYARASVSRTFEGRDRFAPAAAWLARGVALDALGPPVADAVRLPDARAVAGDDAIEARVVHVDRFGNLMTDASVELVERFAAGRPVRVTAGAHLVGGLVGTYSDVPEGQPCALVGSGGYVEVACRGASAAERLALGRGARVRISRAG